VGTHRTATLLVALALALAACTSDDGSDDPASTTAAPAPPTTQAPPATTGAPPPPPTTQAPTSGTLTATLQVDGLPLAGAEVFLRVTPTGGSAESRFACSDDDGVVEFTDVPFDATLLAITGQGVNAGCDNPLFLDTSTTPAYPLVVQTILPGNTTIFSDRDVGVISLSRLPGSAGVARESVAFYVSCFRDGDLDGATRHFDRFLELVTTDRISGVLTPQDDSLIDRHTDSLEFLLDAPEPCPTFNEVGQIPVLYEWIPVPQDERPIVTVIDTGSEPRQVLAYTPEPGASTATFMRQTLSQTQEIDGELTTSVTTTVDVGFTTEVVADTDEGFILETVQRTGKVRSSDPQAQQGAAAFIQQQLGSSSAVLMSPTGETAGIEAATQADLSQLLGGLSVGGFTAPFPTEPLGIGAVWEVESTFVAAGLTTVATTTYTIVGIDGSLVTLDVETVQDLDVGPLFDNPALEDAEVSVTQSGSGRTVWDLATVETVESFVELEQVFIVTATIEGVEGRLEQVTATSLLIPSPGAFAPPDGTEAFVITDATHVEGDVDYEEDPPVGGPHAADPQACGYYDEPISSERAVHSMEHGAVWITHQEDLPPDQVAALEDLAGMPYVLVSPYPGLDSPVVASAWGVQLRLDSADDPRLFLFADWFASGPQTPEPGASC
jgi:hypothetical protein